MVTTSTLSTPATAKSTSAASQPVNVGQSERLLSTIGGGLLTAYGLTRGSLPGFVLAAVGGAFIWRGASGRCLAYESLGINTAEESRSKGIEIDETITVNRPRHEVFAFWRELSNLPRFMPHLESVTLLGDGRSHWVARAPGDRVAIEWDAEITQDFEDERLAWCALPGADIDNAGHVSFKDAPNGRGTEVQAKIHYRPPGGAIGRAGARLFNSASAQMIKQDLRRFKSVMETGEAPTIGGQSMGPH